MARWSKKSNNNVTNDNHYTVYIKEKVYTQFNINPVNEQSSCQYKTIPLGKLEKSLYLAHGSRTKQNSSYKHPLSLVKSTIEISIRKIARVEKLGWVIHCSICYKDQISELPRIRLAVAKLTYISRTNPPQKYVSHTKMVTWRDVR